MKLNDILESLVSPNEYYDAKELYAEVIRCHRDIRLLAKSLTVAAGNFLDDNMLDGIHTREDICNGWIDEAQNG